MLTAVGRIAAGSPPQTIDGTKLTLMQQAMAAKSGHIVTFRRKKTLSDLCREAKANTQPHH